jgi:hypothetical protein
MIAKEEKPKSLVAKLVEVMGEVERIDKKGWNDNQKYPFVGESDVSKAVRPLLAERGVFLWSSVVAHETVPQFKTASGAQMWLTTVDVEYQFIDAETGETLPKQNYPGQGDDTGDKGLPKAQSMSLKYFLLKAFLLSTGKDDAEADERVDKAAAASGAAAGPARVTASSQPGVQRGGKSDTATAAQVRAVSALTVKLGLDAATVVPVICRILGIEVVPQMADLRAWLGNLPSADIAKLISEMQRAVDATSKAVDKPVDSVGTEEDLTLVEAAQETFDIV